MDSGRVLVVDDDPSLRDLLRLHLRTEGYDVRLAADAIEAGYAILRTPPDLLIVDVNMPYMSGIDVLDSLEVLAHDGGALADPPAVLVITSQPADFLGDNTIRRRCPQVVRGVLRKPFDIRSLGERVERLCSR